MMGHQGLLACFELSELDRPFVTGPVDQPAEQPETDFGRCSCPFGCIQRHRIAGIAAAGAAGGWGAGR